jgi:hypothetical protein
LIAITENRKIFALTLYTMRGEGRYLTDGLVFTTRAKEKIHRENIKDTPSDCLGNTADHPGASRR